WDKTTSLVSNADNLTSVDNEILDDGSRENVTVVASNNSYGQEAALEADEPNSKVPQISAQSPRTAKLAIRSAGAKYVTTRMATTPCSLDMIQNSKDKHLNKWNQAAKGDGYYLWMMGNYRKVHFRTN
ncbi:hypothetical protein GQX74_009250, partial [Glossina fuscipes]